jgi:hypothetical protein
LHLGIASGGASRQLRTGDAPSAAAALALPAKYEPTGIKARHKPASIFSETSMRRLGDSH